MVAGAGMEVAWQACSCKCQGQKKINGENAKSCAQSDGPHKRVSAHALFGLHACVRSLAWVTCVSVALFGCGRERSVYLCVQFSG